MTEPYAGISGLSELLEEEPIASGEESEAEYEPSMLTVGVEPPQPLSVGAGEVLVEPSVPRPIRAKKPVEPYVRGAKALAANISQASDSDLRYRLGIIDQALEDLDNELEAWDAAAEQAEERLRDTSRQRQTLTARRGTAKGEERQEIKNQLNNLKTEREEDEKELRNYAWFLKDFKRRADQLAAENDLIESTLNRRKLQRQREAQAEAKSRGEEIKEELAESDLEDEDWAEEDEEEEETETEEAEEELGAPGEPELAPGALTAAANLSREEKLQLFREAEAAEAGDPSFLTEEEAKALLTGPKRSVYFEQFIQGPLTQQYFTGNEPEYERLSRQIEEAEEEEQRRFEEIGGPDIEWVRSPLFENVAVPPPTKLAPASPGYSARLHGVAPVPSMVPARPSYAPIGTGRVPTGATRVIGRPSVSVAPVPMSPVAAYYYY